MLIAHQSLAIRSLLGGHNPYHYLSVALFDLPNAEMLENYEALLPWNITPEQIKQRDRYVPQRALTAIPAFMLEVTQIWCSPYGLPRDANEYVEPA